MPPLPQCDAFGFIYDQAGAPAADQLVTLRKVVDADGNPILLGPLTTTTDATGAYHFTLPQGATAYVSARATNLWSCNGGSTMLVPSAASGELVPAFAPPASFALAPPLQFVGNVLSMPKATAFQDGYLSAADWQIFNAGGGASGGVASFNARTGAVVPLLGDYSSFYLPLTGGTVSGALMLSGDPTASLQAATKQYVDGHVSSAGLPDEYLVTDFNASGSKNTYSGAIGSGSNVLTMATTTDFVVNQGILIKGAGASGGNLLTKVTSVSGTQIILQNTASTTITAVANNVLHDDTVAIQAGLNAAAAGGGTLIFRKGYYRVNGPIQSSTNSILNIPYIQPNTVNETKAIKILGSPNPFQAFMGPQTSQVGVIIQTDKVGVNSDTSIFAVALFDGSNDWSLANQTQVYIENIIFRTYDNPQISGVDLGMCTNPFLKYVQIDAGILALDAAQPTHGTFGLRMPRNNVTSTSFADQVIISNYGVGLWFSEEFRSTFIAVSRCLIGAKTTFGYHPSGPITLLVWNCPTGIWFTDRLAVEMSLDFEKGEPGFWYSPLAGRDIYDPTDRATGFFTYHASASATGAITDASVTGTTKAAYVNLNGNTTRFGNKIRASLLDIDDAGSAQAVSFGTNDSAGSGFRQLKVPNAGSDTTAPVISTVSSTSITSSSAIISWATDELADSQVEYGTTTGYGSSTSISDTSPRVTTHTVPVAGLTASTTYHYRVKSRDAATNLATSTDFTFTTAAAGAFDLLTGLVSMWKLDEASGTRNDSVSTNHLLLTAGAVASGAGKIGNSAHFVGDVNILACASNTALVTGEVDYTLAMWVKLDSKAADSNFASKGGDGNDEYIIQYAHTTDRFSYTVKSGTPSYTYTTVLANTFGSPSVGVWYLLIVWHDATANTMNISINNGAADWASYVDPPGISSNSLFVGAYGNAVAGPAIGNVDELAYWKNRLLGAPERTALWNSGAGLPFSSWT